MFLPFPKVFAQNWIYMAREDATPFPGLLHFILDTYLIMLSVRPEGIKYHFLRLWYDSTWDWTTVSRIIGEHILRLKKHFNIFYIFLLSHPIYIYIYREREREKERERERFIFCKIYLSNSFLHTCVFPACRFRQRTYTIQGLVNGVLTETWTHSCLKFEWFSVGYGFI